MHTFIESLGCVLVKQMIHRVMSHTFLCRNSKAGTVQTVYKKKVYSTGCTDPIDENEDVIIAVTQIHLKIYWHKLLARINNILFRTTVRKIFLIQALILC